MLTATMEDLYLSSPVVGVEIENHARTISKKLFAWRSAKSGNAGGAALIIGLAM